MVRSLLSFGLFLFWLQGCAVVSENSSSGDCRMKLYNTTWQLHTIDNDTVTLKTPATFKITPDGKIGGYDGCNHYFGKAKLNETEITFGPVGATRRFCKRPAMQVERAILGMFRKTRWWQLDENNRLVIFDDKHRLIFENRH